MRCFVEREENLLMETALLIRCNAPRSVRSVTILLIGLALGKQGRCTEGGAQKQQRIKDSYAAFIILG